MAKVTMDDYKKWRNREKLDAFKLMRLVLPFMAFVLLIGLGTTLIYSLPPQSATAQDMDKGTVTLINGDTDCSSPYLVYVDSIKVGSGTLGVGQNITLNVSVPSQGFHYIMISSGNSALNILYTKGGLPSGFTIMLAPQISYQVMS